ncbi:MAG: hypothetical protein LBQ12_08325, partial [Deltaproteobacteria bacterium]|nr:hypothetical protein [Deltaproteobacteria bacterium]
MAYSFLELARARGSFLGRETLVVLPSWPALAEYRDAILEASRGGAVLHPNVTTVAVLERELSRELGGAPVDRWREAFFMDRLARKLIPALGLVKLDVPDGSGGEVPEGGPGREPGDWPGDELASDLAGELSDGLKRIRLAGVPWDTVRRFKPEALAGKVAELGEEYESWLRARSETDREGRRRGLLDALNGGRAFKALSGVREVRFLEFRRLSPFEADFLKALAAGREAGLSLHVPEWALNEIDRVRAGELKRRLIEDLESSGLETLELEFVDPAEPGSGGGPGPARDVPAPLRYAAANLFGPPPKSPPPPPDGRLSVVKAPNPYMECENAVRLAKSLVAEGLEPRGIAVVVPALEASRPMLEDCARRLGVPLSFPGGEPLDRTGPASAVLDLLSLFGSVWERRRVARVLLNPYFSFGFSANPLAAIRESGVADDRAEAGFGGRPGRWGEGNPMREVLERVERLRRLESELGDAAASGGWKAFSEIFMKALEEFGWASDAAIEGARAEECGSSAAPEEGGKPGGAPGGGAGAAAGGRAGARSRGEEAAERLAAMVEAAIARDKAARDCFLDVFGGLAAAL